MTILVTGGAGYIGSHMTYALDDAGEKVVVLDNLVTGIRGLVSPRAVFIQGSVADGALVDQIIREHGIDAVIHFAGSVVVPESVADPAKYYRNNSAASAALVEACLRNKVRHFVFSSTAAVYGMPDITMVSEAVPPAPINPYGRSKLVTEWMLSDIARAHDFSYAALRYFNVAGADPKGRTGQSTANATHLIKRACQVALGMHPALDIFGDDFPTPDGTGVRDYIHVSDLIAAHLLALGHLRDGAASMVLNVGYGRGFSVKDVVNMTQRICGRAIPTRLAPRRAGDPPALVADSTALKQTLQWQPRFDDLYTIVSSAYAWERRLEGNIDRRAGV
jgi:UDP-glucose 4-epimerase